MLFVQLYNSACTCSISTCDFLCFVKDMDLSLNLRFQPAELSFFNRDRRSPFISPLKLHLPTWDPLKYNLKRTVSVTAAKINTEKRVHIEGVSEKLNLIASQNLDFAPARRRVRSAFTEVQQNLDHCLFKVPFFLFCFVF